MLLSTENMISASAAPTHEHLNARNARIVGSIWLRSPSIDFVDHVVEASVLVIYISVGLEYITASNRTVEKMNQDICTTCRSFVG